MFLTTSTMRFVIILCIVTSHGMTLTNENREQCIFPILPVNIPRSYALTLREKDHYLLIEN